MLFNVYSAEELAKWGVDKEIKGRYVPARPMRYSGLWNRIKLAWFVFTGRYDALDWGPDQR